VSHAAGWRGPEHRILLGSAGTPRPTFRRGSIGTSSPTLEHGVGRIVLDEPSLSSDLCRWGERTREPSLTSGPRWWSVLASRAAGGVWSTEPARQGRRALPSAKTEGGHLNASTTGRRLARRRLRPAGLTPTYAGANGWSFPPPRS
jgi:hypothetical protein